MKVIFLDIDGVVNYHDEENTTLESMYFVEDAKLLLLKQIIDATGAYLVLSSSWRYGWREAELGRITSPMALSYYELRDQFLAYGMAFFSKTPVLRGFTREMEILYWLSSWEGESIESYVILDDDEEPYASQKKYFIQIKDGKGLQSAHVERAIEILGRRK